MKTTLDLASESSFSTCGFYRWSLKRKINDKKRNLIFIGLNPSKASSRFDDHTIKRLLFFTEKFNYGSLIVVNLFARISSSPQQLIKCSDPIGSKNDEELSTRVFQWTNNPLSDLCLGWGNQGVLRNRNLDILSTLRVNASMRRSQYPYAFRPLTFGLTLNGHPRHPLYISNRATLQSFDLS